MGKNGQQSRAQLSWTYVDPRELERFTTPAFIVEGICSLHAGYQPFDESLNIHKRPK